MNVVVDTDAPDVFAVQIPTRDHACGQAPAVARIPLLDHPSAQATGWIPAPRAGRLDVWIARIRAAVEAAGIDARPLLRFVDIAREERRDDRSLATWATVTRRRFERAPQGGVPVLELPVSGILETRAWAAFVASVVQADIRFIEAYNAALAAFRVRHRTRSAAQPFPDLMRDEAGRWEAPFWIIDGGQRRTATFEDLAVVPASTVAPKAVTLSLFVRSSLADLAIHGMGGHRYDEVTDDVALALGIGPLAPRVATTADVHLAWGADLPAERRPASAVLEDMDRVKHHPEDWIDHPALDEGVREASGRLLEEKAALVVRISEPDADRKSVGLRIKELNAELASMLEPVSASLREELAIVETSDAIERTLLTRSFSYPVFDPAELTAFLEGAFTESL